MRAFIFITLLIVCLGLCACATSPPSYQQTTAEKTTAENIEWPSGPGTIPPSWYDYNPAYLHWFSPWYNNPATPK